MSEPIDSDDDTASCGKKTDLPGPTKGADAVDTAVGASTGAATGAIIGALAAAPLLGVIGLPILGAALGTLLARHWATTGSKDKDSE